MTDIIAFFVGFALGVAAVNVLQRPADTPVYVPCAVPVYAVQGSTAEELERRAALRMELMERCGYLMQEFKRNYEGENQ